MMQERLSAGAKRSLAKGVAAGAATLAAYLVVVIATTPNLPASAAVKAAFDINAVVIAGTAGAVGGQIFFVSYAKSLGCPLERRKTMFGAGSGSTAAGSFFSFFSLVPLGCCGSWLLVLSFLPSVVGSSVSVALIEYSQPLSYAALAAVLGFAGISGLRLKRRIDARV